MDPHIESVDLAELATMLRRTFAGSPPAGYIRGRTDMRDAVAAHLGSSEATAENIVETMIGRGFLRFSGDPTSPGSETFLWEIAVAS